MCGTLVNTLIASNNPAGNDSFANPKLGPLADNGGPTMTMALLAGSPAIDSGAAAGAPATDQRGVPRPQGSRVDMGAYEYQFTTACITGSRFLSSSHYWLQACGMPIQFYTLQTSTNLLNWSDVSTGLTGIDGVHEFIDANLGSCNARFYRLKSAAP